MAGCDVRVDALHLEAPLQVLENRFLCQCGQRDHVIVAVAGCLGQELAHVPILPFLQGAGREVGHANDTAGAARGACTPTGTPCEATAGTAARCVETSTASEKKRKKY